MTLIFKNDHLRMLWGLKTKLGWKFELSSSFLRCTNHFQFNWSKTNFIYHCNDSTGFL